MIEHPFFIERTSTTCYESVKELEDPINGVSVPLVSSCPFRTLTDDNSYQKPQKSGRVSFKLEIGSHGPHPRPPLPFSFDKGCYLSSNRRWELGAANGELEHAG